MADPQRAAARPLPFLGSPFAWVQIWLPAIALLILTSLWAIQVPPHMGLMGIAPFTDFFHPAQVLPPVALLSAGYLLAWGVRWLSRMAQGVMAAGNGDPMAGAKRDIALCLFLVSVVGITGIVVFSIPAELCTMTPRTAGN